MLREVMICLLALVQLAFCATFNRGFALDRRSGSPAAYYRGRVPATRIMLSRRVSSQLSRVALDAYPRSVSGTRVVRGVANSLPQTTRTRSNRIFYPVTSRKPTVTKSSFQTWQAPVSRRYRTTYQPSTPKPSVYTTPTYYRRYSTTYQPSTPKPSVYTTPPHYRFPTRRQSPTRPTPVSQLVCKWVDTPSSRFPFSDNSRATNRRGMSEVVQNLFPGLFQGGTPDGVVAQDRRPTGNWVNSDGDIHCPTVKKFVQAESVKTNVAGQERQIVHFPEDGLYQIIQQGVCAERRHQSCSGNCTQENGIVYLLSWRGEIDFTFDPFEVPNYCSCKNIQQ